MPADAGNMQAPLAVTPEKYGALSQRAGISLEAVVCADHDLHVRALRQVAGVRLL